MADAPKPKAGGGFNKKVGPFPVKIWIAVAAGLAVLYYLHVRSKNQATTSAGTSSTPTPPTDTSSQQPDTTGGVTNADLLSELQNLDTDLLVLAAGLPTYSYTGSTSTGKGGKSGGNTSSPAKATASTKPSTSHPSTGSVSQSADSLAKSLGGVPQGAIYVTSSGAYQIPVVPNQPGGGGRNVLD